MATHLDLCSGIGGFALAAGWAGYRTIGFCEIDPYCQKVLRKHWPEVPIHDDLRTLTADAIRGWADSALANANRADGEARSAYGMRNDAGKGRQPARDRRQTIRLITAGYPCQPFSQAGKRLGAEDDRHLWSTIAALVAELRPAQCLFENVAGHITLGLDRVLADLEEIGYACRPVVVPACAVNAPHRRDRVWIMANATNGGLRRGRASGESRLTPRGGEALADTDRGREPQPSGRVSEIGGRAGDSGWWSVESGFRRVAHGVPARAHRLRALGNAIVPQVAYEILVAMQAPK